MKSLSKKILTPILAISLVASAATAIGVAITAANRETTEARAASAHDLDTLYSACETAVTNKSESSLWSAVKTAAADGYSSLGYDGLYTAYASTDVQNNKIVDMYSNTSSFSTSDKCGNYSDEGDCYNREHTIPQSWWGGGTSAQGCDIYIVYPTDGKINGMRSNYAFGEVSSATSQSSGGYSKLGPSKLTTGNGYSWGYSGTVFEINDEYKGDMARVYFYAITKWPNVDFSQATEATSTFTDATGSSRTSSNNYGLTNYGLNLMLKWHKQDPVSTWEETRNGKAELKQGNRNPYIDHPEYVEYLWGDGFDGGSSSTDPSASISPSSPSVTVDDTVELTATLSNVSDASKITWTSGSEANATVVKGTTTTSQSKATVTGVAAGSATINCKYDGTTIGSVTVSVTSSGGGDTSNATFTAGTDVGSKTGATGDQGEDSVSKNGITMSTTNGAFAASGQYRVYSGASLTFSSSNNITAIEFSGTESKPLSGLATQTGSYSYNSSTHGASWSGSATSVTFTASAQTRFSPVSVTVESSSTKTLSSISLNTDNVTKTFTVGDTFSSNGLVVTANYDNGTSATVTPSITSPDMSSAGTKTVTVSYTEGSVTKTATYTITVTAASKVLSSISVETAPSKLTYTEGDSFDPTGLVINRVYTVSSYNDTYTYANHTSEFSFSPATNLSTSDSSVTITYGGKTCTQAITVNSSGGSTDTKTDVLFAKGFGEYTTNKYSNAGTDYSAVANSTNATGTTYKLQVFNGSNGQIKGSDNSTASNNFSARNSTTYSNYYISKVELTVKTGTIDGSSSSRSLVYIGSSAFANPSSSAPSGTSINASPASSSQTTLTWTNTNQSAAYFILYNLKTSGSAYSDSSSTALKITWTEKSGSTPVTPTLESITLDTTSVDKSFEVGDTFSYAGLVVTAHYSDLSTATVTPTSVSTPDMSTAGQKTITVTYEGKEATYTINVTDPSGGEATEAKVNLVFSEKGYANQAQLTSHNLYEKNNQTITFTCDKGSNTNAPKYYTTGAAGRFYGSNTFTITSSKANITGIVLSFSSGENENEITADSGTYSNGTWTGTAVSSVTFTIGGTSGHRRIASIGVDYFGASEFADNFNSTIGCNSQGTSEPSGKSNWSTYKSNYNNMLFTEDQNTLKGASLLENGTNIEKAMYTYNFIIHKYGTSKYENFMNRTIVNPNGMPGNSIVSMSKDNTIAIIVIMSVISVTSLGALIAIRKRKEY
ncbi:MAG: endonuclease [Bacilli bacterium]|nr:endonuclease [Bacilli bacterium]